MLSLLHDNWNCGILKKDNRVLSAKVTGRHDGTDEIEIWAVLEAKDIDEAKKEATQMAYELSGQSDVFSVYFVEEELMFTDEDLSEGF